MEAIKNMEATNIGPNDDFIQEMIKDWREALARRSSRTLVREIYKARQRRCDQAGKNWRCQTGYKYVVLRVTDVLKEGTQPAYVARTGLAGSPSVERILKDKKKAEQIKQMIGKVSTLEAAAAALKDSIVTADSVRITGGEGFYRGKSSWSSI